MPALFSEAVLEQAIIDKFKAEGYYMVKAAEREAIVIVK